MANTDLLDDISKPHKRGVALWGGNYRGPGLDDDPACVADALRARRAQAVGHDGSVKGNENSRRALGLDPELFS